MGSGIESVFTIFPSKVRNLIIFLLRCKNIIFYEVSIFFSLD